MNEQLEIIEIDVNDEIRFECPICKDLLLDDKSYSCPHLAFIFVSETSEFEFIRDDIQELADKIENSWDVENYAGKCNLIEELLEEIPSNITPFQIVTFDIGHITPLSSSVYVGIDEAVEEKEEKEILKIFLD